MATRNVYDVTLTIRTHDGYSLKVRLPDSPRESLLGVPAFAAALAVLEMSIPEPSDPMKTAAITAEAYLQQRTAEMQNMRLKKPE